MVDAYSSHLWKTEWLFFPTRASAAALWHHRFKDASTQNGCRGDLAPNEESLESGRAFQSVHCRFLQGQILFKALLGRDSRLISIKLSFCYWSCSRRAIAASWDVQ